MNTHVVDDKNPPIGSDDTISLVEAITALLIAENHPDPQRWIQGLHPDVFITPDVNIQRFLINRYWRLQLQSLPENTMNARYCLVDEEHIAPKDWLRIFKQGVLPCILKNNLPRTAS